MAGGEQTFEQRAIVIRNSPKNPGSCFPMIRRLIWKPSQVRPDSADLHPKSLPEAVLSRTAVRAWDGCGRRSEGGLSRGSRSSTVCLSKVHQWSTIDMPKLRTDLPSVTVVGLDLARHVFQVHCVDAEGGVVLNRSLRRREVVDVFKRPPPCWVGMEACGSPHHWGAN